jgi:uncharacterized membrane protein YbhN (UPF0104 family)
LRGLVLKYLPLGLGLVVFVACFSLVPPGQVAAAMGRLSWPAVAALIVVSAGYYLGRIIRYWLMLRMLGQPAGFGRVTLACLVAQPASVLPGGELYRSSMLKRYANISLAHGLPSVFAQSLAETVGLLLIALMGAVMLHRYLLVVLGLGAVFGGLIALVKWQSRRRSHRLLNALPGINIHHSQLYPFIQKNRVLLNWRNFSLLLAASYISTFSGVAVLFLAAPELGVHLSWSQAAIAYALPTVLGAVSFLPGGLGASDGGTIGILALFGLSPALGVVLALVLRLFTLGVGFAYGFGAMAWAAVTGAKRYD